MNNTLPNTLEGGDNMATTTTMRPEALAKDLGIKGKNLRAYLRRTFPRAAEAKGTTWELNADQIADVRAHFAPSNA